MKSDTKQSWDQLIELLYDDAWFDDKNLRTVLIRIFRVVCIPWENAEEKISGIPGIISSDKPIALRCLFVKKCELFRMMHQITSTEEGLPKIVIQSQAYNLEPGNYLALSTPVLPEADYDGIDRAFKRVLSVTALFRAINGHNLLWDCVFDRLVDLNNPTNWATDMYSIKKLPQKSGGPEISENTTQLFNEIFETLSTAPDKLRSRVELAIEYFDKGVSEEESFMNYWVALEILCEGGRQKAILRRLCRHYRFQSPIETEKILALKPIFRWRDMLMHRGEKPKIEPDVERYIQWMFVDLVRTELGLKCKSCMQNFSKTSDLSSIGLADNKKNKGAELIMEMKK